MWALMMSDFLSGLVSQYMLFETRLCTTWLEDVPLRDRINILSRMPPAVVVHNGDHHFMHVRCSAPWVDTFCPRPKPDDADNDRRRKNARRAKRKRQRAATAAAATAAAAAAVRPNPSVIHDHEDALDRLTHDHEDALDRLTHDREDALDDHEDALARLTHDHEDALDRLQRDAAKADAVTEAAKRPSSSTSDRQDSAVDEDGGAIIDGDTDDEAHDDDGDRPAAIIIGAADDDEEEEVVPMPVPVFERVYALPLHKLRGSWADITDEEDNADMRVATAALAGSAHVSTAGDAAPPPAFRPSWADIQEQEEEEEDEEDDDTRALPVPSRISAVATRPAASAAAIAIGPPASSAAVATGPATSSAAAATGPATSSAAAATGPATSSAAAATSSAAVATSSGAVVAGVAAPPAHRRRRRRRVPEDSDPFPDLDSFAEQAPNRSSPAPRTDAVVDSPANHTLQDSSAPGHDVKDAENAAAAAATRDNGVVSHGPIPAATAGGGVVPVLSAQKGPLDAAAASTEPAIFAPASGVAAMMSKGAAAASALEVLAAAAATGAIASVCAMAAAATVAAATTSDMTTAAVENAPRDMDSVGKASHDGDDDDEVGLNGVDEGSLEARVMPRLVSHRLRELRGDWKGPRLVVEAAIERALCELKRGPPAVVDLEDHRRQKALLASSSSSDKLPDETHMGIDRKMANEYFLRRRPRPHAAKCIWIPRMDGAAIDCPAACLRHALLTGVLYSVLPIHLLSALRWLMWKQAGTVTERDIVELCTRYLGAHERGLAQNVWSSLGRMSRLALADRGLFDFKELQFIVRVVRVRPSPQNPHPALSLCVDGFALCRRHITRGVRTCLCCVERRRCR